MEHSSKGEKEIVNVIAPDWKEYYIDGAYVSSDPYIIRLSLFSHIPKYNTKKNPDVEKTIKSDIVMSKKSFCELVDSLNKVKKNIEEDYD